MDRIHFVSREGAIDNIDIRILQRDAIAKDTVPISREDWRVGESRGEIAVILRKIDNDSIETTPLSGAGTWHSGGTADTWEANQVVVALVDADTVYFPFIDDVASGTSIAKTIKYVADTDCIARARFSDPDIGGQRILPFVQKNVTITDADLTITAIRTADTIAS